MSYDEFVKNLLSKYFPEDNYEQNQALWTEWLANVNRDSVCDILRSTAKDSFKARALVREDCFVNLRELGSETLVKVALERVLYDFELYPQEERRDSRYAKMLREGLSLFPANPFTEKIWTRYKIDQLTMYKDEHNNFVNLLLDPEIPEVWKQRADNIARDLVSRELKTDWHRISNTQQECYAHNISDCIAHTRGAAFPYSTLLLADQVSCILMLPIAQDKLLLPHILFLRILELLKGEQFADVRSAVAHHMAIDHYKPMTFLLKDILKAIPMFSGRNEDRSLYEGLLRVVSEADQDSIETIKQYEAKQKRAQELLAKMSQ